MSNSRYEIKLFYGLGIGSMILEKIRDNVGFQVSVGVGYNKLTAKLACGLNKPAAVTLILPYSIKQVSKRIKLDDVPGLGGKFGIAIKKHLHVQTMFDLRCLPLEAIANVKVEGNSRTGTIGIFKAQEIFNSVTGVCSEAVIEKWASSSIGTSAEFGSRGTRHDLHQLSDELRIRIKTIQEREEEELKWRRRVPLALKLTIRRYKRKTLSTRLKYPIECEDAEEILTMFLDRMRLREKWDEEGEPLTKLELEAQPFYDVEDE